MDRKEIQDAHEKFYPEYDAKFKDMKIETQCIHTGQNPDWVYGAVNVPIYASSTFEFPKAGEPMGKWCYSRLNNPTKLALAGLAAITSVVELVKPGEEIISINDLYGGTQNNFRDIMAKQHGVQITFYDFKDLNKFKEMLNPKVKLIYLESPTNPNLNVVDVVLQQIPI